MMKNGRVMLGASSLGLGYALYSGNLDGILNSTMDSDISSPSNSNNTLTILQRGLKTFYVFGKLVAKYKYVSIAYNMDEEKLKEAHQYGSKNVLDLCKQNGGLFIKLAQFASELTSTLPPQYTNALSVLRDNAPSRPIEAVKQSIEEELKFHAFQSRDDEKTGSTLQPIFSWIDPIPIGSASLAQVHRARLTDGREVAVKIQHSDMERVVKRDLALVHLCDNLASWIFKEEQFTLSSALNNFDSLVNEELNFENEAKNAEKCRYFVESDPDLSGRVWVPAIIDWKLVTPKLIVMEYINGLKIDHLSKSDNQYIDKANLAQSVLDLYGAMIFKWGFIHGDCHLGNIMIVTSDILKKNKPLNFTPREGEDEVLVLLDHGLYCTLPNTFRKANSQLWVALILRDLQMAEDACTKLGLGKEYAKRFSVYLTNRSISGTGELGDRVTETESKLMREELSDKKLTMKSFNEVATDMPREMLFILKTMHLVKQLHHALDGKDRDRFLTYGQYAVQGMSMTNPSTCFTWSDLWNNPWLYLRFQRSLWYSWTAMTISAWWKTPANNEEGAKPFSFGSMLKEEQMKFFKRRRTTRRPPR